jgi:8-oxo-dGTP pyrophosphatase MutT (NUDIX family)
MKGLASQITEIVSALPNQDPIIRQRFLERAREGELTRDENDQSHFCAYFLPYNPETGQYFIVHHKKAGLWLAPGGHVDKGEDLLTTLNREIDEELGVKNAFTELPEPFLISTTTIDRETQPCKEHLDFWFLFKTDGNNFHVDPHEFYSTMWTDAAGAKKIMIDPANLQAMDVVENIHYQ